EENFYRQLHSIGNGFDWRHKVETYDPYYYRWTQWLFIQLFKAGLAYRKKAPVNFCPSCKTVLADEQAIEKSKVIKSSSHQAESLQVKEAILEEKVKVCERCDSPIEKRELEQWFFRITKYADRLLTNIEKLNWTEKVKIAQRNWIGKKMGISITYPVIASESEAIPLGSHIMQGIATSVASGRPPRNDNYSITVFTTRPDTNFGATFIALAPEHELITRIKNSPKGTSFNGSGVELRIKEEYRNSIIEYVEEVKGKSEIERQAEGREKTGVFTGLYAINQLTGFRMPVWVSDFVLSGFGTGALVGVPGHDKRDFEFAQKFGLEIKRVVTGKDGDTSSITRVEQVQEEEGVMVNSGFLDGMNIHEATEKMMDYMEEKGWGKREVAYHLRDWLISRQRYWGPPIPMVYCEVCASSGDSWFTTSEVKEQQRSKIPPSSPFAKASAGLRRAGKDQRSKIIENSAHEMRGWYPVEEEDLPVELPYIKDFKPLGTGNSPLANHPEFYETRCSLGHKAKRETDVSDTFLDSSWYFLRYTSTGRDNAAFDKKLVEKWLPVNMYIGGAEHSVLHLLYARFVTMVLYDLGYINFEEPFARFYAHGLIVKDGAKMSKSRGNVINPDEYIRKFGADTLRMYLHFLGPFDKGGDFRDTGIEGMSRFLKRVYNLFQKEFSIFNFQFSISEESLRMMHGTIAGVTEDMENLRYNTAIAKLMSYYNFLVKQESVSTEEASVYLRLLAPFAPYLTEELWQNRRKIEDVRLKKNINKIFSSIHLEAWPNFDPQFIQEDTVTIAVQVNGKMREMIKCQMSNVPTSSPFAKVSAGLRGASKDQKYVEEMAKKSGKVSKYLEGRKIFKVIYVQGKVINFVVE
ncbi:leucine--tRNA ligase, partial [Patescibacteria group bacterium]|nr:leucine--tRNA ligase [Patescibacteria group bacterium]